VTLTELTTALHRWADKHGGKFPDSILCNEEMARAWSTESSERFAVCIESQHTSRKFYKGVRILDLLNEDDDDILFASSPLD